MLSGLRKIFHIQNGSIKTLVTFLIISYLNLFTLNNFLEFTFKEISGNGLLEPTPLIEAESKHQGQQL